MYNIDLANVKSIVADIVAKHNGYTEGAEEELIEKVRELVNK